MIMKTTQQTATAQQTTTDSTPLEKYQCGLISFAEYLDTLPPRECNEEIDRMVKYHIATLQREINELIADHQKKLTAMLLRR